MRVRGISSNTLINVDNGGGNMKSGLAPSIGYMRRADKSLLFRMKSHRKKHEILMDLSETETNKFIERLEEVFNKLEENNEKLDLESQKPQEDLKKEALRIVKEEFKEIVITDDDIVLIEETKETNESIKKPIIGSGRKPKKKVTKHVPLNTSSD